MQFGNPYKAPAGEDLDAWIHKNLFSGKPEDALPYSSDEKAAEKVRLRIKALYGSKVETGSTKLRQPRYFARFETGPSTSTETLAESLPLAICRLALVVAFNREATKD